MTKRIFVLVLTALLINSITVSDIKAAYSSDPKTIILLGIISYLEQSFNKMGEKLSNIKRIIKNKLTDIIHWYPKRTEYKGKSLYVCNVQDCDFCFRSKNNSMVHLVKYHIIKDSTASERFKNYPEDDQGLSLALQEDMQIDDTLAHKSLVAMAKSYIETME